MKYLIIMAAFMGYTGAVFYAGGVGPRAELKAFVAETKEIGELQEKANKVTEAANQTRKESADAKYAKDVAALNATVKRLRDLNPDGSFVLAASATSKRPDLLCFDRVEYQRTDGIFTAGARGLADEGTARALSLASACEWAQVQPPGK